MVVGGVNAHGSTPSAPNETWALTLRWHDPATGADIPDYDEARAETQAERTRADAAERERGWNGAVRTPRSMKRKLSALAPKKHSAGSRNWRNSFAGGPRGVEIPHGSTRLQRSGH